MTTGEKIKRIRIFRGMTQKELGVLAGLGEPNANIRIAQYECDARIPRANLLDIFAQVLKVNPLNFHSPVPGSAEDVIQTLFTTGLYFQDSVMNNYLREWLLHQQELRRGEITRDQYFEWKLNWPYT